MLKYERLALSFRFGGGGASLSELPMESFGDGGPDWRIIMKLTQEQIDRFRADGVLPFGPGQRLPDQ